MQEDIERADALMLAHTLNEQLVRQMIDFSFGPPKDGIYPQINIGRPDEAPVETIIEAVQKMGPQGFKVASKDLYSRLNLEPPEDGDETVGIAVPPQPALPATVTAPQEKAGRATASHFPTPTSRDGGPPGAAGQQDGQTTLHAAVGALVARQASTSPAIIEALTDNLAREAAAGLGAMTDAVRREFEQATSMADLADRLERLHLPDEQFA